MNIGIIGMGYVGTAVKETFKNFHDIKTFDINLKYIIVLWTKNIK